MRFLRGEENPFDAFIVSDKPAHEFPRCHVAEVHREEFTKICLAIDKYRNPDYAARRQLHDTRTLIVRGVRGSGKTHLLQVLRQRETETPEVWVCPRYFDPAVPFSEYVLTELVRALVASDEPQASARLQWCAAALGRRLLCQAIAPLSDHEWEEWAGGPRSRRAWGRRGRDTLLDRLWDGGGGEPLQEICVRHGLAAAAAYGLVIRHVEQCERGAGVAARMRREVLLAFAEMALGGGPLRLASLLEEDFAQADTALPPARAELVATLLQTLTEILAAVRVPVVAAFDNMERLLAPRGTADLPAAQSFFNGLAHLTDQTRGLLLILFVERGLWNELGQAINTFADHRLRQGVRLSDFGCVWDLELGPPSGEQIERVVQRRMEPLLRRAPGGACLPPCFPFDAAEVRAIAAEGVDVLRTALLRLRDRYDEIVLPRDQRRATAEERAAQAEAAAPAAAANILQRDWEGMAAAARKRLQALRRSALAHELHAGLGRWLESLTGQQVGGWVLAGAESAVPYGDHPAFGLATIGCWRDEAGRTCRVALGPILGEGRAMPKDLEVKCSVLSQRPPLADQLVVLWPVPQGTIAVPQLPPATRQVWERCAAGRCVWLAPLPLADFAWLLGFPEWYAAHARGLPHEALRDFVLPRTGYLLQDLAPRPPLSEV